jgi:hypothetical protein
MTYASKSESTAATSFAACPAPVVSCQTFAPLLSTQYADSDCTILTGKPDFFCQQLKSFTFMEFKNGRLNRHRSHESSRAAMQYEYSRYDPTAPVETHSFLSSHFWKCRPIVCLDHAFNHSLYKVAALQALHGWQRYIVVFKTSPTKAHAKLYIAAGLVFCTVKTAPDLLRTIELCQYGIFLPFNFKTRSYSFTVTPDHRDFGKAFHEVQMKDQCRLTAAIAAADHVDANFTF